MFSVFRWIFVFDIAIYYNLTFNRGNNMRSTRAMRNENVYITVSKHWSERLLL